MLMEIELQFFFKPRPLPYSMRKKAEEDLQRLKQDEVNLWSIQIGLNPSFQS